MTRLFIRFYVGVLLILLCAWSIQAFVTRQRSDAANIQVVEQALGGGVRLARQQLELADAEELPQVLRQVRGEFDYPVAIEGRGDLPGHVLDRFEQGDDAVLMGRQDGGYIAAPLGQEQSVLFGPLPAFVGPTQAELMTGLGIVLLLAAGAIAMLLRPVARQFRLIERTATAIAGGDFSARVDEQAVTSATTLAAAFNNMASHTETLLRTQRELLQAVSHELRTPLSRIHFAIDLIRDASNDQQRLDRLDALESASQELDELVGELLRYVRLETSQPQLEVADVEFAPLVRELLEKQTLLHPDVRFELEPQTEAGEIGLTVDRASLERALGNLIRNAARFARTRVLVAAQEAEEHVLIDVDDDGPGIPVAERERVFAPFVRLEDSDAGAGLGLALVRRIVVSHGGQVSVDESPLGGCRIRTVWPRVELTKTPETSPTSATAGMS